MVALALCVAFAGGSALLLNQLVAAEVAVDAQWAQVENQLTRQHDLIPNLVEVTRASARHERDVLTEVARARARLGGGTRAERVRSAEEFEAALGALLVNFEAYPRLEAGRGFRDLEFELAGSQNRVSLERHRYNEAVALFNARRRMWPWRLVAWGFEPASYFDPPAPIDAVAGGAP